MKGFWLTLTCYALLHHAAVAAGGEAPPAPVAVASGEAGHQARMLPKPAVFESWGQRADFLHHNVPIMLDAQTYRADTMFLSEGVALADEQPSTTLRLGMFVEGKEDQGFEVKFDPDFEVDVSLPNLESQWKVFVKGTENDELPGTDPTERERGMQLGVRKPLDRMGINLDAGVKVRWLPEAFAKVEWRPDWYAGLWKISPRQRVYYETDDGFGEVSSLSLLRWFGENQRGLFQSVSAARWTEDTEGVEWEQSLKLGHINRLLDESKRGTRAVSVSDVKRAYGLRYSLFGHDSGESVLDRHRLTFAYRWPVYREWLFMSVSPELEWEDENDWDMAYGITLGLDMLFWESDETPR